MGLQGTISPSVGYLSFLAKFDLYENSFHGHLIPEGAISLFPTILKQCQKLEIIALRDNQFTGVLPNWSSSLPSLHAHEEVPFSLRVCCIVLPIYFLLFEHVPLSDQCVSCLLVEGLKGKSNQLIMYGHSLPD